MAAITNRFFQSFEDRCLLLANEEWCRPLSFGSNWTRIRIGFLAAVTANGTGNITDATIYFGLSAGNTAPVSASLPTSFIGASFVGSAAAAPQTRTLTFAAGANPYYSTTTGMVFRKIGPVLNSANFTTSAVLAPAWTGTQRRRLPYVIDIQRQVGEGGAVTISVYGPNAAAAAFDYRPDQLLDALDQVVTPVINGQTMTVYYTSTSAINQSDLVAGLDTICLYWGRIGYPLEVYAVGACLVTQYPEYANTPGGAFDTFDTYSVGTITGAGTITGGSWWSGTAAFYGTANPSGGTGFAGTVQGYPWESFDTYGTGTVTVLNDGIGWRSGGAFYGTANPSAPTFATRGTAYFGTTQGFPWDNFEGYSVGAITTGVTINGGLGWNGVGYIYP